MTGADGSPPGRPRSPRRKPGTAPKPASTGLGEAFLAALHADFLAHGAGAIERVRLDNPTAYIKLCDALLPKDVASPLDERGLSDEELDRRIGEILRQCQRAGLEIGTAQAAR
ncbi:hypothetical protein AB4037_33795 [Labrys sp. KB_33_2]|uniref:hypothetical protein n=1 Tax=Labrys sp. KB_33_2 TaxID=3237479 RepID=UPI003F928906